MPSRSRAASRPAVIAPLLAVLLLSAGPLSADPAFTPREIARAVNRVKADPNLATERTIRTLKWQGNSNPPPTYDTPSSLAWLLELAAWLAQSARMLVWVAAALLVSLLAIYLFRLLRGRMAFDEATTHNIAPTHIQDLDIRPESLPNNIGAEARALWDRGQHRAALSLLYRGLLSRLVHVHNIPIRDSSTEGDTLGLAASRLKDRQGQYVARLIRVWQHAVYGGQQPQTESLYLLCDEFAAALDTA